jgi:hypothetical protein
MTIVASAGKMSTRVRNRGWLLVAAQFGFAAWFVLCSWLALARAAHFAGHWYLPTRDDPYTANADIYGGWPWAYPVTITMTSAAMVAAVALIVTTFFLLTGDARGSRALTVAMAGGAVAMLLVLVASLTPAGLAVSGWLLD